MTVNASEVFLLANTFERATCLPLGEAWCPCSYFTAHLFSRLAHAYLKKSFGDIGWSSGSAF